MGMILIIVGTVGFLLIALTMIPDKPRFKPKKLVPGQKLTNRKGKHYTVGRHGNLIVDPDKLIRSPEFQKQLKGFESLYKQQTLSALLLGEEPPNSVGGYGILTKKKLKSVWNDDWQAELDKMSTYYDVTYNSFFGIEEEFPEVSEFLTADEIAQAYGSKEKED